MVYKQQTTQCRYKTSYKALARFEVLMNRSLGDITMADMEDYRRLRLTQDQYQG